MLWPFHGHARGESRRQLLPRFVRHTTYVSSRGWVGHSCSVWYPSADEGPVLSMCFPLLSVLRLLSSSVFSLSLRTCVWNLSGYQQEALTLGERRDVLSPVSSSVFTQGLALSECEPIRRLDRLWLYCSQSPLGVVSRFEHCTPSRLRDCLSRTSHSCLIFPPRFGGRAQCDCGTASPSPGLPFLGMSV